MKKILLAALLVSGCFFGLVSCDNGKYDATPDIDKSGIPNPLDKGDGQVNIGTISFKADGRLITITDALAEDSTVVLGGASARVLKITGAVGDLKNSEAVQLGIIYYKGPGTYTTDSSLASVLYFKTSGSDFIMYGQSGDVASNTAITITEEKDKVFTGTFEGVLYHEDYPNTEENKTLEITEGKFKVSKR